MEKTQNQNESLNGMVWQRIPKEVYVGREILEMGLNDAVAHFNMGTSVVLKLLDALGIPPGKFTEAGCNRIKHVSTWHRERAKVTPNEEEKFSGAKEKEKMTKQSRQRVPIMPLDSFRHFRPYIVLKFLINNFKNF